MSTIHKNKNNISARLGLDVPYSIIFFFFLLRGSVCDAKPGPSLKRRTKLMLHSLNTTTLENVSALFVFNIIKLTLT